MDTTVPMTDEERIQQIRDAFEKYLSLGLPVIPVCPHDHKRMSFTHRQTCKYPGKVPIIEQWSTHNLTTREHVELWLSRNPYVNIGLPLGDASGIVGVDVDGAAGERLLQKVSKGFVPDTWEFTTNNGRRLLYRLPKGVSTKKFKIADAAERHQELAFLCTGQQTVMPPSIHASGKQYQWVEGHNYLELDLADAPGWLLDIVAAPSTIDAEAKPSDAGGVQRLSPPVTPDDWNAKVPQGQRNTHLTKLAGSLIAKRNIPKKDIVEFLDTWNRSHCDPPLPRSEIEAMVTSIMTSEMMKESRRRKRGDRVIFRPTLFATRFVELQRSLGFSWKYSTEHGAFYRCDDAVGPWQRLDNAQVSAIIRQVLIDTSNGGHEEWDSSHYVNEGVAALKDHLAAQDSDEDIFDLGKNAHIMQQYISVENGLLDWRELRLLPWDSNFHTTIQLPVKWDEAAECPTWLKVLSEWVPDEQTRDFLQEFVGLCLIPDTSYRTAVFLYGSGANGKSLFLEAIQMLFGKALVAIPLHKLAERFEVANIQNKLVNICGDIDAKYLSETGTLKALIGGDTLRGEFKHGKSFDFIPVARLMFSANALPKVSDKSPAWYSRWRFIPFPNTFKVDSNYKIQLKKQLTEEKAGIFRWAVEGLRRLKLNNSFTTSKYMEEAEQEYKEENDSVLAFLRECVEQVPHEGSSTVLSTSALHLMYKDWCEQYEFKPVNQIEFTRRATQVGMERSRRPIGGKTCAVFLGCKIREGWEQDYNLYAGRRPRK